MPQSTIVLYVGAVLYVAVGAAFALAPEPMAGFVDVALGGVTADNDVRAVYGGANVGLGVFLALAATRPAWQRPALVAMALALGGMATARLLSWGVAGLPGPLAYLLHASEVAGVAFAWLALRTIPD